MAPKRQRVSQPEPEPKAGTDGKDVATPGLVGDHTTKIEKDSEYLDSAFASRYVSTPIAKNKMPANEMPGAVAKQIIKDLRMLDANPRLNLASFVTTWMEKEADELINESLNVNYVDMDEYPSSTEIHNRCVKIIADLFHVPDPANAVGSGTIGSSEAIIMAGLAMKRRWQERRRAEGKSTDKPNLVCGFNVQVCWEKFCRYAEVEENFVPLTEDCFVLTPERAKEYINENTIGVCGILGSTYNGAFEDIEGLDKMIEQLNKETGWNVPIHVDGASGGFIAPFIYPDLKWDFRLKNVVSINASGHKYGLVYPGVGWVMFRSKEFLPEHLVFHTMYLGSDQPSFTLNFSKGASHIIAQYYQFLRLGRTGYTKIMTNLKTIAKYVSAAIEETGHFDVVSDDHSVPLVAIRLKPYQKEDGTEEMRNYDEFDISDRMKFHGWVLPAYTMAPNANKVKLLRAVIREDMSAELADCLVKDLKTTLEWLDSHFVYTLEQLEELKQKFQPHRHKHKHPKTHNKHKHNAGVC